MGKSKKKKKGRTFVMSDIHGAYKAMMQVLRLAQFNPDKDTLIFNGDVCDSFPETHKILDYFLTLPNFVFVMGNHDVHLKNWLEKGYKSPSWLRQGGIITTKEYANNPQKNVEHVDFFKRINSTYVHVDEINRVFVHAGFNFRKPILCQKSTRVYCYDRRLWYTALKYEIQKRKFTTKIHSKRKDIIREIFIGHSPVAEGIPMRRSNVWNTDTGAGRFGRATLMNVNSKEYYQSDPVRSHYPPPSG